MRYKKAPILEAALEFRWSDPVSIGSIQEALEGAAFGDFGDKKPRIQVDAKLDIGAKKVSHTEDQLGFEVAKRDASESVILERQKFVFIQRAPYDCWDFFEEQAMKALGPVANALGIEQFARIGLRFINRIDIPHEDETGFETGDYVTLDFGGPKKDIGVIEEFQMRVVKPTENPSVRYALAVATTASPLPHHSAILLDIDVFSSDPISVDGPALHSLLVEMRNEKNDIFEGCITDRTRNLFGGLEE